LLAHAAIEHGTLVHIVVFLQLANGSKHLLDASISG